MRSMFRPLLIVSVFSALAAGTLAVMHCLTAQESVGSSDLMHRVETGLRALKSEGCDRREAVWSGRITPGKRVMLPFFFFKENDYFLVIAADDARAAEETMGLEMLDLVGIPIACHTGVGEGRIVVAARPVSTGTAYLSMTLPEGGKPVTLAVGCAYR